MKISDFVLSSAGLLVSMKCSLLIPAILFGILAMIAFQRIMREVQSMEEEGGDEDEGRTF